MTFTDIIIALNNRFLDAFEAPAGVQIFHDNAPHEDIDESRPHVRVQITPELVDFVTMGGARSYIKGSVFITINVPKQAGWADALELIDEVVSVYANYSDNIVNCMNPQIKRIDLELWMQHVVIVPFNGVVSSESDDSE